MSFDLSRELDKKLLNAKNGIKKDGFPTNEKEVKEFAKRYSLSKEDLIILARDLERDKKQSSGNRNKLELVPVDARRMLNLSYSHNK